MTGSLVPPLAYIIVFQYVPMYGVQIAFRDFRAVDGILGSPWVGLKYILRFIKSYQFERVVGNTLFISLYTLLAGFPIPIILALLIHSARNLRLKGSAQFITYAPHFISTVVMVGIMLDALSVRGGWINRLLTTLGGDSIMFMGEPAWFSTIFVASEMISTFIYKRGFASGLPEFSYGAAIGLFNAVINFILLLSVNAAAKRLSQTALW